VKVTILFENLVDRQGIGRMTVVEPVPRGTQHDCVVGLVLTSTPPLTAAGCCRRYHRLYQQEKEDEEEMAILKDQGSSPGMAAPSPTSTSTALHCFFKCKNGAVRVADVHGSGTRCGQPPKLGEKSLFNHSLADEAGPTISLLLYYCFQWLVDHYLLGGRLLFRSGTVETIVMEKPRE
jgi:hypothetical protein